MSENKNYEIGENVHHYLGIELNMQTWNLLGKKDRSEQDDNRMIAFAKGSQYHWYKSPSWKPVNAQRGEWMISHVYAVLEKGDKALEHADRCFELTKENELSGFDLAYSYEALARAYSILKDEEKYRKYFKLATEAGFKIKSEEDRKIFEGDLKEGPWTKF